MTDQEEFKKWLLSYSKSMEFRKTGWGVMINRAWQACAERKNEIIKKCNSQTEHFERLYYLEKDKVEQQAKDIDALRSCLTKSLNSFSCTQNIDNYPDWHWCKEARLILTGEK